MYPSPRLLQWVWTRSTCILPTSPGTCLTVAWVLCLTFWSKAPASVASRTAPNGNSFVLSTRLPPSYLDTMGRAELEFNPHNTNMFVYVAGIRSIVNEISKSYDTDFETVWSNWTKYALPYPWNPNPNIQLIWHSGCHLLFSKGDQQEGLRHVAAVITVGIIVVIVNIVVIVFVVFGWLLLCCFGVITTFDYSTSNALSSWMYAWCIALPSLPINPRLASLPHLSLSGLLVEGCLVTLWRWRCLWPAHQMHLIWFYGFSTM